jgi:hypothetical protein
MIEPLCTNCFCEGTYYKNMIFLRDIASHLLKVKREYGSASTRITDVVI